MPFKKFAKKPKANKGYRPRRKYGRKSTALTNRALHPIPQRFITKMKYSEVVTTDATTGVAHMNLNSIYDPNRLGAGHQPYGFDTLATLYNRYRVIACGYRVQLAVGSTTVPVILTAIAANQAINTLTASEIRENPRSKYVVQNPGASSLVLHNKHYIPSIVGRSKAQYMADDRYQAETNSNPNEIVALSLQTFSSNDTVLGGVQVQIVMEYTVEFFDIKSLGQSLI